MQTDRHRKAQKPSPTFYKTQRDLEVAMCSLVEMLRARPRDLQTNEEGYYPIKSLCTLLRNRHQRLSYVNRNHIVELYYKDLARDIHLRGDFVRYDVSHEVQSSEILHYGIPVASLFKNNTDLSTALVMAVHLLRNQATTLDSDEEGYFNPIELCDLIKTKMPYLNYMDRNHIVELFFKDRARKIIFRDPFLIKYKTKRYVQPPPRLYFGTIENLARKMRDRGIFSGTKRYIKLYENQALALSFAQKFATQSHDMVTTIEVDSEKAFEDGLRFSTYKEGEYIVAEVRKEYIIQENR